MYVCVLPLGVADWLGSHGRDRSHFEATPLALCGGWVVHPYLVTLSRCRVCSVFLRDPPDPLRGGFGGK